MADSRFALSNEIVVDQLKLNAKKLKHDWINTNMVYTEVCTKDGFFYK